MFKVSLRTILYSASAFIYSAQENKLRKEITIMQIMQSQMLAQDFETLLLNGKSRINKNNVRCRCLTSS